MANPKNKETENTEIATTESTTVAEVMSTNFLAADIDINDCKLPYLYVVQPTSKCKSKKEEAYIEGAREGMIADSIQKIASEEVTIIPVFIEKKMVEVKPDKQESFVAMHAMDSDVAKNYVLVEATASGGTTYNRTATPEGNFLVETHYYGVIYTTKEGQTGTALLPFKKTSLRTAKDFNTLIKGMNKGLPQLKMTTVEKSNTAGIWFVPSFKPDGYVQDADLIERATSLRSIKDKVEFQTFEEKPATDSTDKEQVL